MRKTKLLQLAGRSVTVGEPTMEALWGLLQDKGFGLDVFDALTGAAPVPAPVLALCSDLTAEELGRLTPSELREVVAAVREVGLGDFFALFEDLAPLASLAPNFCAASACSSVTATTPGATAPRPLWRRLTSWASTIGR